MIYLGIQLLLLPIVAGKPSSPFFMTIFNQGSLSSNFLQANQSKIPSNI
jgi:hypothetical protein